MQLTNAPPRPSRNRYVVRRERGNVYAPGEDEEGHCVFIDQGAVVDKGRGGAGAEGEPARPTTRAGSRNGRREVRGRGR